MRQPAAEGAGAGPGAGGGRGFAGGPGGQGAVAQVLWAVSPLEVGAQSPPDTVLNLQPGMTVGGRVVFAGATVGEATDPTRVRVSLATRGAQTFEIGGALAPVQADESGRFSIVGVAPGRYTVSASLAAGAAGRAQGAGVAWSGRGRSRRTRRRRGSGWRAGGATGQWFLESAVIDGRDILDFPIDIGPNQNISSLQLTFNNRRQELSGTIQDASGRPTVGFHNHRLFARHQVLAAAGASHRVDTAGDRRAIHVLVPPGR